MFIGSPDPVRRAGTELQWIATVELPELPGVEGQGIAWDRSGRGPTLWAIQRSTKQVKQFDVPYGDIEDPVSVPWQVNGPGEFVQQRSVTPPVADRHTSRHREWSIGHVVFE